jgi:hypothetical protein
MALVNKISFTSKTKQKAGTALPSMSQMLLEENDGPDREKNEYNIKLATSTLFAGGSDTVQMRRRVLSQDLST